MPLDLAELVAAPPGLERYLPRFRYELLDLGQVADESLPAGVVSRAALLALKYIFRPEMQERVVEIMAGLRELEREAGGLEYTPRQWKYGIQGAWIGVPGKAQLRGFI